MTDELKTSCFRHRIQALQRLCSTAPNAQINAILVVPGVDGRNNKEALGLLKYIFCGVVGRELLDGSVVDDLLEEVVLLIQETSVSVLYNDAAKAKYGSVLSHCPCLIEYIPRAEEDDDIDAQQARKVSDFKRMMIESVLPGSTIGMGIPLGYETVLDVESWPLLQSFALDSVVCPTGFFTARYSVADVSEYLRVIYRTVDELTVSNAITVLRRSVLPHVYQTVFLLDSRTSSASHSLSLAQRSSTSAEDAAGPLEMLFEFGELECADCCPPDPALKPVMLFENDTSFIGADGAQYPKGWQERTVGENIHAVFEGCEPCTGIRFCRTYFLKRGKSLPYLRDSEALVGDEEEDNDLTLLDGPTSAADAKAKRSNNAAAAAPSAKGQKGGPGGDVDDRVAQQQSTAALQRLEGLYVKLWYALRASVRLAFSHFGDVLEAGTFVQRALDAVMKGKKVTAEAGDPPLESVLQLVSDPTIASIILRGGERLKMHMDCINSIGEVVTIDDVDDMGGSCWTYIRVSVDGVSLAPLSQAPSKDPSTHAAVAVGDTFLFSVGNAKNSQRRNALFKQTASMQVEGQANNFLRPIMSDSYCLTHAVPYYRVLLGVGEEETSAQRLLACLRSPHMLQALGLGDPVESNSFRGTASAQAARGASMGVAGSLALLTDYPLAPLLAAEVKFFTDGFVVERAQIVGMEQHVAELWTIDFAECYTLAHEKGLLSPYQYKKPTTTFIAPPNIPEGLLVVVRLKDFASSGSGAGDNETKGTSAASALEESPSHPLAKRTRPSSSGSDDNDFDRAEEEDEDDEEEDPSIARRRRILENAADAEAVQRLLAFNPLQRSLSDLGSFPAKNIRDESTSSSLLKEGLDHPTGPTCIAMFVPAGSAVSSRVSGELSAALVSWRISLKSNGIPEHRGKGDGSIPEGILRSFVSALDSWSLALESDSNEPDSSSELRVTGSFGRGGLDGGLALASALAQEDPIFDETLPVTAQVLLEASAVTELPATGYLAMRCGHSISESIRLQPAQIITAIAELSKEVKSAAARSVVVATYDPIDVLVFVGHAGSGVYAVGWLAKTRLQDTLAGTSVAFSVIDLPGAAAASASAAQARIAPSASSYRSEEKNNIGNDSSTPTPSTGAAAATEREAVRVAIEDALVSASEDIVNAASASKARKHIAVVTLVTSAAAHVRQADLIRSLLAAGAGRVNIAAVISVVSAAAVLGGVSPLPAIASNEGGQVDPSANLFGLEMFRASGLETCHDGLCHMAVVVDGFTAQATGAPSPAPAAPGVASKAAVDHTPVKASKASSNNFYANTPSKSPSTAPLAAVGATKTDAVQAMNSAYPRLLDWILENNPAGSRHVVRVQPSSIRLDAETIDLLASFVSKARAARKSNLSVPADVTSATYTARYDPQLLLNPSNDDSSAGFALAAKLPVIVRHSHSPSVSSSVKTGLQTCIINPGAQNHRPQTSSPPPAAAVVAAAPWSLPSLVAVLQYLFPRALLSCPSVLLEDTWKIPPKERGEGGSGLRRAITLARAKVFSGRRCAEEKALVAAKLSALKGQDAAATATTAATAAEGKGHSRSPAAKPKSDQVSITQSSAIQAGIMSVHAVVLVRRGVSLQSQTEASASSAAAAQVGAAVGAADIWVSLEACAGAIIVREIGEIPNLPSSLVKGKTGEPSQALVVQGTFSSGYPGASLPALKDLLESCFRHKLEPRPLLNPDDVTKGMMEEAQGGLHGPGARPLPASWFFDGNVYVDFSGTKRSVRPDIDEILGEYLSKKNGHIKQYNQLLIDFQEYL